MGVEASSDRPNPRHEGLSVALITSLQTYTLPATKVWESLGEMRDWILTAFRYVFEELGMGVKPSGWTIRIMGGGSSGLLVGPSENFLSTFWTFSEKDSKGRVLKLRFEQGSNVLIFNVHACDGSYCTM